MSLLVIGLSHHTAPMSVLEVIAADERRDETLADALVRSSTVDEVVVLTTCNRLEVYAEVPAFHPAVAAIGDAFACTASLPPVDRRAGEPVDAGPREPGAVLAARADGLADHLYVRYDDGAVAHAFTVACGLDSMAVGESQVLGQMRAALARGQASGRVGASLNALFQQALRVGKRAHSETDIDGHSVSLVQAGLEAAAARLGPLDGCRAAVVGTGAMSGLAAATLGRTDVDSLSVVGRTAERAERLAATTGGTARAWDDLADVVAESDLVLTCTGAAGHVLSGAHLRASAARRSGHPQVFIDLAVPRDIEPYAMWPEPVPGVSVIGLEELGQRLLGRAEEHQVDRVRDIVTGEVAAFLTWQAAESVAPTVAALRGRAAEVVAAELSRLDHRMPDLGEAVRAEVELAVHRVVEKLLHTPTRRVKEFAIDGSGADYAAALRELFDLEPRDVANVSVPPRRTPT
ncbi:MAG: glutamyl-tRNA reductase [Intrasporangium sp.]|uniref:glutamyl-tRNA reductase n=1 Tax=Intrasporangium sp. TaxID=1925024 RepID=UPI002646FD95|nr:glutamyl-tRNA reductase [Intrasporangium sp.]MDN5796451.1 glutamyl-tRNA reductase [Intrasporangium sp.]